MSELRLWGRGASSLCHLHLNIVWTCTGEEGSYPATKGFPLYLLPYFPSHSDEYHDGTECVSLDDHLLTLCCGWEGI